MEHASNSAWPSCPYQCHIAKPLLRGPSFPPNELPQHGAQGAAEAHPRARRRELPGPSSNKLQTRLTAATQGMNLYEAHKSLHFPALTVPTLEKPCSGPRTRAFLWRRGLRRGGRGSRGSSSPTQVTRGPAQLCGRRAPPQDWLAPCQNRQEAGAGRMALGTMRAVPPGLRPARHRTAGSIGRFSRPRPRSTRDCPAFQGWLDPEISL